MNMFRTESCVKTGYRYNKMNYKVSVIVPIYKVEKFIARCADSLLRQTLEKVEFIFVNDATPDKSMEVLREVIAKYPVRKADIVLLVHDENKGLPAARNTGLEHARGEYIFHCDSDDYVEPDMLEKLYQAASEKQADIVWCDWFLSFAKNERYMKQPDFATAEEALRAMLGGRMKFNVWNKLVKRELYTENNITFPSGYALGEDMTMMMLFVHAKRVTYMPKAFYHYVKLNASAISSNYSEKSWDALKYNVTRIEKYLQNIYGDKFDREIAFLKLEVKFPLLIMSAQLSSYHLWNECYPEANSFILKNKNVSLRSRIVQICAHYHLYGFVWLHYQIVCRLVYGIIYR